MNKQLRIVFMGTPEFAVASLAAIFDAGYDIAGVITAPDKPAGRGKKVKASPVKIFAAQKGLQILQPTNLKDPLFVEDLKSLRANLGVVVAFRMLPEVVWNLPEFGTFNLHASLLPQYRGAAPINHVILNGETETGVTTFFLKHEIDTGDIIMRKKIAIGDEETAGELHDRLMVLGAEVVLKTLEMIQKGDYQLQNQQDLLPGVSIIEKAPKIFKEDCRIDWNSKAEKIYNQIRGLSPYPAAYSTLIGPDGEKYVVKIYGSRYVDYNQLQSPGTIETDNKTFLSVYTSDGKIFITELQVEGKKRLSVQNFLNGFKISDDWKFLG